MANSYLEQDDSYLDAPQGTSRRRTGPNPVATLPTTYAQPPVDRTQFNNSFATPADNQFAQRPAQAPPLNNAQYIDQIANPPAAAPLTANQLGQQFGQGFRSNTGQAVNALAAPVGSALDSTAGVGRSIADFGRGALGYGPAQPAPTQGPDLIGMAANASSNLLRSIGAGAPAPQETPSTISNNVAAPSPGANFGDVKTNQYGRMINGVMTFSDGSIPGTPTTINPNDMQQLIKSSAAPSKPYLGPEGGVLSAAGVNTPQQGVTFAALNRLPGGYDVNTYDPREAQSRAQSDISDIISKDPRSTLGRAAWNASVDLSHAARRSRYGAGTSPYENAIGALTNQVNENLGAGNRAALAGQQGGIESDLAGRKFAYEQAINSTNNATKASIADVTGRSRIEAAQARVQPHYQQDANGNLYAVNGNAATPVTSSGQAFNAQPKIDAASDRIYREAYNEAIKDGKTDDEAITTAQKAIAGRKSPAAIPQAPQAGAVVKGYRFKGGDPSDQANWEKA